MLEPIPAPRRTILHVRMSGLLEALVLGEARGSGGESRGAGGKAGIATRALEEMLATLSPVAESAGDDAVFVELRRCAVFSGAQRAGLKIRRTVAGRHGERCAIGIGPNRLIAYMASGVGGGGIVELTPGSFRERFRSAPVEPLPGVGTETAGRLRALCVYTIGQLADADPERLVVAGLGVEGARVQRLARGVDDAPTIAGTRPKALGDARRPRRIGARLAVRPSPAFAGFLRAG